MYETDRKRLNFNKIKKYERQKFGFISPLKVRLVSFRRSNSPNKGWVYFDWQRAPCPIQCPCIAAIYPRMK